jgi:hypothetical protein
MVISAASRSTGDYRATPTDSWITPAAKVRIRWRKKTIVGDTSNDTFQVLDGDPPTNQPPSAALTAPVNGETFTAPAAITIKADANDGDGTVTRVDFYQASHLLGSDATAPYSFAWNDVGAGSYSLTAVAIDDDGATGKSSPRTVIVNLGATSLDAIFTASVDHETLVISYLLEIFDANADTATAIPIATQNLGKPLVVNRDCTVDVGDTINGQATTRQPWLLSELTACRGARRPRLLDNTGPRLRRTQRLSGPRQRPTESDSLGALRRRIHSRTLRVTPAARE